MGTILDGAGGIATDLAVRTGSDIGLQPEIL